MFGLPIMGFIPPAIIGFIIGFIISGFGGSGGIGGIPGNPPPGHPGIPWGFGASHVGGLDSFDPPGAAGAGALPNIHASAQAAELFSGCADSFSCACRCSRPGSILLLLELEPPPPAPPYGACGSLMPVPSLGGPGIPGATGMPGAGPSLP